MQDKNRQRSLRSDSLQEAVRHHLITYPGITQKELSTALSASAKTISKHIQAIRKEWKGTKND